MSEPADMFDNLPAARRAINLNTYRYALVEDLEVLADEALGLRQQIVVSEAKEEGDDTAAFNVTGILSAIDQLVDQTEDPAELMPLGPLTGARRGYFSNLRMFREEYNALVGEHAQFENGTAGLYWCSEVLSAVIGLIASTGKTSTKLHLKELQGFDS